MEGFFGNRNGQAIVESIMGITFVILVVALTLTFVLLAKQKMKHDYLGSGTEPGTSTGTNEPIEALANKVIFFDGGAPSRNLHALVTTGWNIDETFKLDDDVYFLLNKDGQQMVFSKQLGVKICTGICLSD